MSLFLYFQNRFPASLRLIVLLLVLSLLFDQASMYAAKTFGNNMPLFRLFDLLQVTIIVLYIYKQTNTKTVLYLGGLSIGGLLINNIFLEDIFTFSTNGTLYAASFTILICFHYYYWLYHQEGDFFIERQGSFWIVTGILLYFSGSFFTFLLYANYIQLEIPRGVNWAFHNVSSVLKNIIFTIGIWVSRVD